MNFLRGSTFLRSSNYRKVKSNQGSLPFIPTSEQEKFINWSRINHCRLLGVPGSGKTITMINRLQHLIDHMKIPKEDIHVLAFSRSTKADTINKIRDCNFSNILTENVKTLDGMAREVLKKSNKDHSNVSLLSLSLLSLLENDFDTIQSLVNPYKYLFIDEAQDLRETQIKIIEFLIKYNNSKVCLVGDPCQSIYQFLGANADFLKKFEGEEFFLSKSFRSHPDIIHFSNYFRKEDSTIINETQNENRARKVIEINVGTTKRIEDRLLKELKSYDGDLSEIAILSPTVSSRASLNIGLSWVANLLKHHRIPYTKHYKDISNYSRKPDYSIRPGHVNLITFTASKGLEWKYVILLDFSLFQFGFLPTESEYQEGLNLFYVALTRAREKLLICHKTDTGLEAQKPEEINIQILESKISGDPNDILSQFRNPETNYRDENLSEDEEDNAKISNMIHPMIKEIDRSLYKCNITAERHIQTLAFDIKYLESKKQFTGTIGVTEFLSILNEDHFSELFNSPNFSYKVKEEKIFDNPGHNFSSINQNDVLAGIISENLLYHYMDLLPMDYVGRIVKGEYIYCDDYKVYTPLKKLSKIIKSWDDAVHLGSQKKISSREFRILQKNKTKLSFRPLIIVDKLTKLVISDNIKTLWKVNNYNQGKFETNSAVPNSGSQYWEYSEYTKLFYVVYNSIIQYALSTAENEQIISAWDTTKKFLVDNKEYINNIKKLAQKLKKESDDWTTQREVNDDLGLVGIIDLLANQKQVYEVKASKSITKTYLLQTLLYSFFNKRITRQALDGKYKASIINLKSGIMTHIDYEISELEFRNFLEKVLKQLYNIPNFPVYLFHLEIDPADNTKIYHIALKEISESNNILNTYVKYRDYTPQNEDQEKYLAAPNKYLIETQLKELISKQEDAVFFCVSNTKQQEEGLIRLSQEVPLVINIAEFFKNSPLANLNFEGKAIKDIISEIEKTNSEHAKIEEYSTLLKKLLSLSKLYIEEYRMSYYL